jgi:hypothetical protein
LRLLDEWRGPGVTAGAMCKFPEPRIGQVRMSSRRGRSTLPNLGRVTRPDDKGSLIVFTGIHRSGSLGVVQMLVTELAELYAEVKTTNFSVVVGTD